MNWDHRVGSSLEEPTLLIKWLFHRWGRRIDLHKMVRTDEPECYHTHPANKAFRIVLWGGYVEEREDGTKKTWYPGMMGWVRFNLSHRIHSLRNGRSSYSLWFRGRVEFPVLLLGKGWAEDIRQGAPSEYRCEACGDIIPLNEAGPTSLVHPGCQPWEGVLR